MKKIPGVVWILSAPWPASTGLCAAWPPTTCPAARWLQHFQVDLPWKDLWTILQHEQINSKGGKPKSVPCDNPAFFGVRIFQCRNGTNISRSATKRLVLLEAKGQIEFMFILVRNVPQTCPKHAEAWQRSQQQFSEWHQHWWICGLMPADPKQVENGAEKTLLHLTKQ